MSCLGDVVAALVDGELDHAARERAQRHLAHCTCCRAEVEAQRRLKARLTGDGAEPAPSDALTARLLGLRGSGEQQGGPITADDPPAPLRTSGAPVGWRGHPGPPVPGARPRAAAAAGLGRQTSVSRRRRARGVRRGAAVGSALAVLGAAFLLGGPQAGVPTTPVDPGSDAFVADFVSTSSGPAGSGSSTTGPTGAGSTGTGSAGSTSSTAGSPGGGRPQR